MKSNPNCPTNCIREVIETGMCDCYNKGSHPERPCLKKDGMVYEISYFFGKLGAPKDKMDETTPCVRTKCGEGFLCAECEFL